MMVIDRVSHAGTDIPIHANYCFFLLYVIDNQNLTIIVYFYTIRFFYTQLYKRQFLKKLSFVKLYVKICKSITYDHL